MDENADEGEVEKESLQPEVGDEEEKLTTQQRKEIEAIQRAMAAENERAGTAQSRQSTNREDEDVPTSSKGTKSTWCYWTIVLCDWQAQVNSTVVMMH